MSKIVEKVVSAQLCSLQKNDIYEEFQLGFRPHHSTETALVKITNDLLLATDQSCISLLVLLDRSAGFDTIDHDIIIDQLQNYTGIQGQALRWFRSVFLNPGPGRPPTLHILSPLSDTPISHPGVSSNELMSWIRCVWLGRHAKCALLGGAQDQGWETLV